MSDSQQNPLEFYGPTVSTYMRIAEIVAEEKGARWVNIPTDPHTPEHRQRHPFERAPTLAWHSPDGWIRLYETIAIASFIDGTFGAPDQLMPSAPLARATCFRWMSMVDQYIFPVIESEYVGPRILTRLTGVQPDDARATRALGVLNLLLDLPEKELALGTPWLAGSRFSFADIWLACVVAGLMLAGESRELVAARPHLSDWLRRVAERPSWQATEFKLEPHHAALLDSIRD